VNELAGSRQQGGPDFNATALFARAKLGLGHGGLGFHRCLALLSTAITAITTRNSIGIKPRERFLLIRFGS
jgi:hypothetical protein